MPNNLFLSWSGKTASLIAGVFNESLNYIINEAQIFYSKDSITKDEAWFHRIQAELKDVKAGIIFITKDNVDEPWILFEAGALFNNSKMCVLCCDISKDDLSKLKTPLKNLNATNLSDREDLYRMIVTLKNALELKVPEDVLKANFNNNWARLESRLQEVLKNKSEIDKPIKEVNIGLPDLLAGKWHLSYYYEDGNAGGEDLEIGEDGKYYLYTSNGPAYYFQLIAIPSNEGNLVIQKVQVFNNIVSESVHSVETLHFENENVIVGMDTFGHKLKYERIK